MRGLSTAVLLATLVVCLTKADINVSDYVYWKKADISAWHEYFPSRTLEEERLTNTGAQAAAQSVDTGLAESLRKVVWYQAQELQTAQLMMEGSSAQGCVQGIASYIDNAINDEVAQYDDCTADVLPRLTRQASRWSLANSNYQSVYQRVLSGIDSCARTYPNKDSRNRLKICVEAYNKIYFTVANNTQKFTPSTSPSMSVFTSTVAGCAETAALNIVAKGWKFLDNLVHCAKVSENMDAQLYETQVTTGFNNYLTSNNLTAQIVAAQTVNTVEVSQIEEAMVFYYDLQKRAKENYVIESRSEGTYVSQVYSFLSSYFSTVSTASADNPGSAECASAAYTALYNVVNTEAASALQCDQEIVKDAKSRMENVRNSLTSLNALLPSINNAAILSCFSEGYIYAENTIHNCFSLAASSFSGTVTEVRSAIVQDVNVLQGYEQSFFNSSSLPCADTIHRKATLGAERVLYDLQRCLYIKPGTNYDVPTPSPTSLNLLQEQATAAG